MSVCGNLHHQYDKEMWAINVFFQRIHPNEHLFPILFIASVICYSDRLGIFYISTPSSLPVHPTVSSTLGCQRVIEGGKALLPNRAAASIQVLCCHCTYNGPHRCILIDFHRVHGLTEHWRFIHVQHIYLHSGSIFEWTHWVKSMVKMEIGGLHLKGVCLFRFEV